MKLAHEVLNVPEHILWFVTSQNAPTLYKYTRSEAGPAVSIKNKQNFIRAELTTFGDLVNPSVPAVSITQTEFTAHTTSVASVAPRKHYTVGHHSL